MQRKYPSIFYFYTKIWRQTLLTGRPNRDSGKVFPPESIMVLSVVEVHVAKLRDVQITKVELVKLVPGDVTSPIRCRHSATYKWYHYSILQRNPFAVSCVKLASKG